MRDRSQLVGIAGISWIALTLLLTWQALRGQSIIAPDGVTLGALLGTATLGLTSVILRARTHAH